MCGRLPVQLGETPRDLGLHIERLAAAGEPAGVARLHEGPDLGA
jgi:hypothetical protein